MFLNAKKTDIFGQSLIDWTIVLLTVPLALMGTLLGVFVNQIVSDSIIVLLLLAVLMYMTLSSCWKFYSAWQKEKSSTGSTSQLTGKTTVDRHATHQDILVNTLLLVCVIVCGVCRAHMGYCAYMVQQRFVDRDAVHEVCNHPFLHFFPMGMLERSVSSESSILAGETVLLAVPICCCFIVWFMEATSAINKDVKPLRVFIFSAVALGTGILAGLVGVGGGLVFSPFFLLMGFDPFTTVASSSTCVLFTSTSTAMQYLFADRVELSLLIIYGSVGCCGAYLGTYFVTNVMSKLGRGRLALMGIVALAVSISTMLAGVQLVEGLM